MKLIQKFIGRNTISDIKYFLSHTINLVLMKSTCSEYMPWAGTMVSTGVKRT